METGDAGWPTDSDVREREPNDDFGTLETSHAISTSSITIGGGLSADDFDGFLLVSEPGSLLRVRLARSRGPADRFLLSWNTLDPDGFGAFSQSYELQEGDHAELFVANSTPNQLGISAFGLDTDERASDYVLEVEQLRQAEPGAIALDQRVSVPPQDAALALLEFKAPFTGSYQFTAATLGGLDVGIHDVAAQVALQREWESTAEVDTALRFDAIAGQVFWLLGSAVAVHGEYPSFELSVQFEAEFRELRDGDRVEAQIDPQTALGVPDTDTFLVELSDGEALRVEVRADGDLDPALVVGNDASLPVEGRAARELECRGESCEWELSVTDARSLDDPSASVGGPGFGYSISADAYVPAPLPIELPFATDSAELGVVGNQLRYRGGAPVGDVLLCEAIDPRGEWSFVCERTERSISEGHVSLMHEGEFSIYVRELNHRGPSAVEVSIRSAPVPAGLPLTPDDALSVPLALPARVGGPALTNPEPLRIAVEVEAGAYLIATASTEHARTSVRVQFEALTADGTAYLNTGGQAGFRAATEGMVELVVDARCEVEDTPCSGQERYELTVFEDAVFEPPAVD